MPSDQPSTARFRRLTGMKDGAPNPLVGLRVRLDRCTDEYTRLSPGELGTVSFVDSVGTVHVDWDSGARLGLCADAGDRFTVLG